ncbi:MAG TPA: DUF952 domain-containing protein [Amycolatopsis sp.]|nr:DUF952 domain-containing protein [Amycolatopsis sp.]
MILHICSRDDWAAIPEAGEYRAPSLAEVGFIHCSDPGTVSVPANALYRGRADLLLLEIDPTKLDARVVWEEGAPPHPDGILFPHVYGPISTHAVVAVHDFPPGADRSLKLPESLSVR